MYGQISLFNLIGMQFYWTFKSVAYLIDLEGIYSSSLQH